MIVTDAAAGRITDPFIASSSVYQFMTELVRLHTTARHNRENWPEPIRQATKYIENDYASMISMDELAERVALSKYHFIRRFSASTGLTQAPILHAFELRTRWNCFAARHAALKRSHRRLDTQWKLFYQGFSRFNGLTPGEFRSGGETSCIGGCSSTNRNILLLRE